MLVLFIIAADVAIAATALAVASRVTLHALLYLAVSLIAVAVVFYTMGAPFVAALEVIIYAGAIVVLFLFAVMLLAPGEQMYGEGGGRGWSLAGPAALAMVLLAEMVYVIVLVRPTARVGATAVPAREVGIALFGPYALGIELASMLLLVALIGVRHLAGQWAREAPADAAAGAEPAPPSAPAEGREEVAVP